jgi:hypothetical protein
VRITVLTREASSSFALFIEVLIELLIELYWQLNRYSLLDLY